MSPAFKTTAQRTKRLHLLDAAEVAALYDRPCFSDDERAYYFALTSTETTHMQTFTNGAVQAFFVLQLGYFKAKQRFFSVKLADVLSDLICIVNQHGLGVAPDDLRLLNPRTLQHQRQIILDYVCYRFAHAQEHQQAYQVVLQALWEYDHIYRSAYLLEFIDSPQLRQNVQRALNRGEQYHQLKRALTQANAGKLRYAMDEEQELWNECSRLLVNAILYYNMIMLSEAVMRREQRGDTTGAARLKAVSPVAWTHVNFYGRYTFSEEPVEVPIDGFVETMAKYAFHAEALLSEETIERYIKPTRTCVRRNVSGRAGLNPSSGTSRKCTSLLAPSCLARER